MFTDCEDFTVRTLRDGILHFLMVFEAAVRGDRMLAHGANVWRGSLVHPGVSESLSIPLAKLPV